MRLGSSREEPEAPAMRLYILLLLLLVISDLDWGCTRLLCVCNNQVYRYRGRVFWPEGGQFLFLARGG